MTTKAAFSAEEWTSVLEGPASAGLIVVMAARGGMFRETMAMSKAYVEARAMHGQSELLDEIVAAKPKMDHTRYHSPEELKDTALQHLRTALRCWRPRRRPKRLTSTSASFSPSRTRSRLRTGSTVRVSAPPKPWPSNRSRMPSVPTLRDG